MRLQVLFDENGRVIGTASVEAPTAQATDDAPQEGRLIPGPGQQIAELDVDDEMGRMENAVALHARLRGFLDLG